MVERKIKHTKEFMRILLLTDAFDAWELSEGVVTLFAEWRVDGRINGGWYGEGEKPDRDFCLWGDVRPFVTSLIRGKRTPLSFRFMLYPGGGPQGQKRVCRIRFVDGCVLVFSGVNMTEFSMDREPELSWDKELGSFLDGLGVDYEEM